FAHAKPLCRWCNLPQSNSAAALSQTVMLGLVPGIHVLETEDFEGSEDVDGRDESGHDEGRELVS
ncbi:MAG: hypothetical protein ACLPX7_20485, partial [Xanthobacteraceae bacterium]